MKGILVIWQKWDKVTKLIITEEFSSTGFGGTHLWFYLLRRLVKGIQPDQGKTGQMEKMFKNKDEKT